ncbi:hypothetical protein BDV93DRAFT_585907 [Ceratobasidium sp. AG-I]|nr:hypothetical protein BDV93DRAFT_585907 [Ceratobasidium sp. AG-I]
MSSSDSTRVDTLDSLIQQGREIVQDYKLNSTTTKFALAISYFKSAVLMSPPSAPFSALIQLGYSYAMLAGGDPVGCEENAERAVQVTSHTLAIYQELCSPNCLLEARIYDALGCAYLQRYTTLGCFGDCESAVNAHRSCLDRTGSGINNNVKAARQYHLALALDAWSKEDQGLQVHQEITILLNSACGLTSSADSIGLYSTFLLTTATTVSTDFAHIPTAAVIDEISHCFDTLLACIKLSLWGYPFCHQSNMREVQTLNPIDQISEQRLQLQVESIEQGAMTMFESSLSPHTRNAGAIQLASALLACARCYRREDMFSLGSSVTHELLRPYVSNQRAPDLRLVPGLLELAERLIDCRIHHGYDDDELLAVCEFVRKMLPLSHIDRRRFHFCMGGYLLGIQEKLKNSGTLNLDYLPVIEHYRAALRLTPDWHPRVSGYVSLLSTALIRSYSANHNQADHDEGRLWQEVAMTFEGAQAQMQPTEPGGEIYDLYEATQGRRTPAAALAAPFVTSLSHPWTRVHDAYVMLHAWQLSQISDQEFMDLNFQTALQFNNRSLEIFQHLLKRMRSEYLAPENSFTWDVSSGGEIETKVAMALLLRSRLMKQLEDMPKAIAAINKSIVYFAKSNKNNLPNSPDEMTHSCQSSRAYYFRYMYLNNREDLDTSIQRCRNAVASAISLRMEPSEALQAALIWADTAKRTHHESAYEAYDTVVSSLVRMVWVGWDVRARFDKLKTLPLSWVAEAVLCAISEGDLGHSIELFESGRSILFSQSMPLRNRNNGLEQSHPELLAKLEQVGKKIDKLSFSFDTPHDIAQFATANDQKNHQSRILRTLGEEWDNLVFDVRAIPGQEDFLQTISVEKLCLAARKGPVALIIASERAKYCHAIVIPEPCVQSAKVIRLPALYSSLPKLHSSIEKALAHKFRQWRAERADPSTRTLILRPRNQSNPDAELATVLLQLWREIMYPIIWYVNLVLRRKNDSELPHLWISPTDKLASLPLHAAGLYKPNGTPDGLENCVSSHVICSYTPSLSSLLHDPPDIEGPLKVFALGAGDGLMRTNEEVETVIEICSAKADVEALVGDFATIPAVRAALQDSNIAHFACHGKQDPKNPLHSRLSISEAINIQVEDLMKDPLPNARLAILFACETAQGM